MLGVALAAIAGALGHSGGVAAAVPPGWHVVAQQIEESTCDPVERLALATYGLPPIGLQITRIPRGQALVIVLEDHVNSPSGYHRKPQPVRIAWQRPERFEGCCGLPTAPGWELFFRSRGRDLIVLVHVGRDLQQQRRGQILRIVSSIHG
jgi:hypothetical protein